MFQPLKAHCRAGKKAYLEGTRTCLSRSMMPRPSEGPFCWLAPPARLDRGTFQSPERRQNFVCWEITQHSRGGRLSRHPFIHQVTTYTQSLPFCPDLLAEAGVKESSYQEKQGSRDGFQCHRASASTQRHLPCPEASEPYSHFGQGGKGGKQCD